MRDVLQAIDRIAASEPGRPAITDATGGLTYGGLQRAIGRMRADLAGTPTVVGLLMSRGAAAVAADLALAALGRTIVPLPDFFSAAQWAHMIGDAAIGVVVTDAALAPRLAGLPVRTVLAGPVDGDGGGSDDDQAVPALPEPVESRRIIYTSGTTGRPKGVVLDEAAMTASIDGLARAVGATATDVHCSVLPLALLLEQLAGVLLPLRTGARVHLAGSPEELFRPAVGLRPTTTILVPELLAGWVRFLQAYGLRAPESLRLAAVGGAPVGAALADAAWACGVPVHEGYGLSECCSVVALNRPGTRRAGTVGRPLDHLTVSIDDGEIVVRGPSVMSGYLGGASPDGVWRTGDLGQWDDDGHLTVLGRKDDVIVTPAGRNIHPEWIEPMLLADPGIRRAAVVAGPDGLTAALLVADGPPVDWPARVAALTADAPAYARPVAVSTLSPDAVQRHALFTPDGRPRRRRIAQHLSEVSMTFYEALVEATTPERKAFMTIPLIHRAVADGVDMPLYLAFLASAYNHVRHTVALMEAALAHCGPDDAALADGLREYVIEEAGHDEWILDDIAALGGDAAATRAARPPLPVRTMVAYAYLLIREEGPYALLGMVHVLEGMSVALADKAAAAIRDRLGRGDGAGFSYLISHGGLDIAHVNDFARLLTAIDTPERRATVIAAARDFYRLYGDVFRSLAAGGKELSHAA